LAEIINNTSSFDETRAVKRILSAATAIQEREEASQKREEPVSSLWTLEHALHGLQDSRELEENDQIRLEGSKWVS
jgi:hypothetical protein